jgi:hypothetical protein
MNAVYTRGVVKATPYGANICNISFYTAVCVIEKSPFINRDMQRFPVPVP